MDNVKIENSIYKCKTLYEIHYGHVCKVGKYMYGAKILSDAIL
jgi:hypothetical protein